ncbi:MAG TPA: MobF family relaxase [Solirubrobacteraceae bacterium]|nr:MobF family relaxase [Solirubrobacteraceae bacterium]
MAQRALCELLGRFGALRVITHVMTAASIGASRGGGYARYLESKTVEPERGDYYLTPDGEMAQAPGRWLADAETLERLGVQTGGPVDGADFIALMEGHHPGTGRWLRPEGAGGGRGGGIDVTFSAPKSVSTVWALGDPWQREQIEQAHARAVEQTIHHLREQVPVVRRRYSGQVVEEHAKDVIATEYRHTTARGVSGAQAPDPQLHSHVVITGAVREDDRIVAVASRPIFRSARELGAFYRSALADELVREGYTIEHGTGKDGRYFEIAGVPRELCDAFSGRSREVARAAERFRARYGRAPERGELRNLALENRRAKTLTTRSDLQRVWTQTARDHGFGPDEAVRLIGASERPKAERAIEDRVEANLTGQHAVFEQRDLRTVVLEQAAGEMAPDQALAVAREMIRDRRVLTLEGGRMTTLAIRAQEQAIERRATQLAQPAGRDIGHIARDNAAREVSERIGGPLSAEQHHALEVLTGPERAAVLVGPAGTGKGVVIDAATRAEHHAGHETIGVAVSGSTAERLGADSPALAGQTLTLDSLVARANTRAIHVGRDTTVILDEAGMVDHKRLDALTELVERSGAKLIAVGDGKQLPSIGPGGMFDRLANHAPTAQLTDIHRTKDPADQRAWQALRAGEPERAMAHYASRGQLHLCDTHDQAAEHAVQTWATLTKGRDLRQVALIADAANTEIDRLNARAQHLRAERGELGHREIPLPGVHYGLREGDLIAFTTQHRPRGQPRIENGTRGQVSAIHDQGVTITIDGSQRKIQLAAEHLDSLRLAYAQHVYRQQGATVERSVVLTGGWQTSKETAYVEATRARHGTDWFIAREDLGVDGQDPDRITRLAQHMRNSRAQAPSLVHPERPDPGWLPSRDPLRLTPLLSPTRWLTRTRNRDTPDRSTKRGR